jgi:glycosyltransferase involved in cell wall biosynthesis
MKQYDLSIVIPSRNEEFAARTVEDIVKNKRGKTEVIVVLDGAWADPPIADHPDVRVVYLAESIGQRAATNLGVRLSKAKYIAKCDAHTAYDEGFDVKLMDSMQDNYTIVPVMRNLHAFSWACDDCGHETYQGPIPEGCANVSCPAKKYSFHKEVKWVGKPSPQSTAYLFNRNLQFWYFNELKKRQNREGGNLVETMSLQGSFFMLTREKYWELDICDETWGSWGQQGTEVSLKTWLSGGRVVCNTDTWYAHMFRTQHGFSFPYPMSGKDQRKARAISQDLFLNNKWSKQIRPLSWVLDRFWPELQEYARHADEGREAWRQEDLDKLKATEPSFGKVEKGIIFYTDNQLNLKIARKVQDQLRKVSQEKDIPIVSASLKPMDNMGRNIRIKGERGVLSYFRQIVAALEASNAETVYFCEHDVLYHPSHFDFTPPTKDKFYYNHNVWRLRVADGFAVTWAANQVAELVCNREFALEWYRKKLAEVEAGTFDRSYEPGGRDVTQYEAFRSEYPNIDIRHGDNLTKSKWSPDDFRDKSTCVNWQESTADQIPGWHDLI